MKKKAMRVKATKIKMTSSMQLIKMIIKIIENRRNNSGDDQSERVTAIYVWRQVTFDLRIQAISKLKDEGRDLAIELERTLFKESASDEDRQPIIDLIMAAKRPKVAEAILDVLMPDLDDLYAANNGVKGWFSCNLSLALSEIAKIAKPNLAAIFLNGLQVFASGNTVGKEVRSTIKENLKIAERRQDLNKQSKEDIESILEEIERDDKKDLEATRR